MNGKFIFTLQTLTGKEIEIDIEPTDKVDRIKERVEEKEGIPPQQQRLIFSGKQMYFPKFFHFFLFLYNYIVIIIANVIIVVVAIV